MNYFDMLGKQVKIAFMRMTETEAAGVSCAIACTIVILAVI